MPAIIDWIRDGWNKALAPSKSKKKSTKKNAGVIKTVKKPASENELFKLITHQCKTGKYSMAAQNLLNHKQQLMATNPVAVGILEAWATSKTSTATKKQ